MIESKAGKISPFNFFSLIFISKVLVAFTSCTFVLRGEYSSDILISIAGSMFLSFILMCIIIYACKNGKSPLNNKWVGLIYGIYFIFVGSILVTRFSFFASTELNPESQILFYCAFIIAFCVYGAMLGIEPLARFSLLVFAVTVIGIIAILMFGIYEFEIINLFPFTKNSAEDIIVNSLYFAGDSSELVLFLGVSPKVNGNKIKPLWWATGTAYVVCIGILAVVIGILGDTATMSAFPLFEVSQVSKFSDNERLDSVYTAFWIFAVFLKCTSFLYASTVMFNKVFQKLTHKKICIVCGIIMMAFCTFFSILNVLSGIYQPLIIVPYIIFGFVIPIGCLIFQKKDKGEILIEKF